MPERGPQTYYSLNEFRALFRTGLPVLTWHKLGPRPAGVRLKGLYMSAELFAQQLQELQADGLQSASLGEIAAGTNRPNRVVLSFDDGYENVLRYGLPVLSRLHFQAVQFLVADRLGQCNDWDAPAGEVQERLMDQAQVRAWLAAGQQIGSHSLSHPFLTQMSLKKAREEIFASKAQLEDMFGLAIEHFCYPYGAWNQAVRDLVAEAGYRTACTTDFGVNPPGTDRFALKRITARYRSRNWQSLLGWVKRRFP